MNKPPAFQFYPDDFLGGTITMSLEERGFYITLLCIQWSHGAVSKDDIEQLGKGMAQPLAKRVLAKFNQGQDGLFRNERMEKERKKQETFRANRSESGKTGAEKRWHSHSSAIAQPMAKHSSPSPSPSSIKKVLTPTLDEVKLVVAKTGLPESDAVWFWNKCEGNGWTNGGKPIKSWPHVIAAWKAAFYMPSQKQTSHNQSLFINPNESAAARDHRMLMESMQ